ncbi:MAG: rhodanese-like domain-containing protein [Gammaproteobacteria bacterium]|nr:rhodanese-like domain-containing protein [Gammaproteobacteria bacterium]
MLERNINTPSKQTLDVDEVDAQTAKSWLDDNRAVLIDVREADEYQQQNIEGACLAPLSSFDADAVLGEHEKNKLLIIQCRTGGRSCQAAKYLLAAGGTKIYNLTGGIEAWKAAGFPVVSGQ